MNYTDNNRNMQQVCPGIWRITLGQPESLTPATIYPHQPDLSGLEQLPFIKECPIDPAYIAGKPTPRGYLVTLPLNKEEQFYGLGLQLQSFNQRGKKKKLRVNSDPITDMGDSHAPVPFYITTNGYGVMIDTLRYLTIYFGVGKKRTLQSQPSENIPDKNGSLNADGADELYKSHAGENEGNVVVEIPCAKGVDLYFFAGPEMQQAVQRYNLFSGGGCLPPMWGLGVWYRCKADFKDSDILSLADAFRETKIPCDVLGIEPGWQSHSYSCSYSWSSAFPDPKQFMSDLKKKNFHANLWTHAFTHPSSPIYEPLSKYAGDQLVWDGLVPDFADEKARQIYAEFHEKNHVEQGASGYKLDECDNSDYIDWKWSFPEYTRFPSGLDGEQMHSALGVLYMKTIQSIFDDMGKRTYGEVRSSGAFAAPLQFVLYSDLYEHKNFIRGVSVSSFSGLLWCPEVRHAVSAEDLIRRIQSVVFSPQALVNAWYIKNPPWKQWITDENNADHLHADREMVTDICRNMFEIRMRFLPYLYMAFVNYYRSGIPPFRALVMEDPNDPELWNIDSAYMMGDRVLVAPVVAGVNEIDLYLPKGGWRSFWTGEYFDGGRKHHIDVPIQNIPVFVKDNSVLPLAQPAQHSYDPVLRQLTINVYGSGEMGFTLFEDDGETYAYKNGEYNVADIQWNMNRQSVELTRKGSASVPVYEVVDWKQYSG